VSHSGCYAVYPHLRNLPDDILKEVVELGGVIGLPTATFMLHTSDNTLTSFFTHLRHAINLVGERNVAIGSDGIYHYLDPEAERRLFDTLNTKIDPRGNFMARCPGQPPELNTSERMLVLERSLKEEAFTPSQIENVLGNNLFHFFQSVL
jgi:membrane dipeptidase